ncbi:MAG TPA: L,D-transpeptidase [Longimicrobium sp.]|jgi:lipoprotein-anchoring transpeptidase ErfK/SrfK|nr:L,D-transpeptidase [Longimicrobium sp.]
MRKLGLLAAAFGTALSLGAAAPAHAADGPARVRGASFYLSVDLSERMLYVMKNGEQVESYPVAIGQRRHPTPTGQYRIRHLVWNPRWVPPDARWARGRQARGPGDPRNPMGRVKLFFKDPDLYIHGTHEVDSLGSAESHGCLRMRNSDVVALGRTVMQNGGAARDPGWFRRVLNRVSSTREVGLSDPVLVEIHA